MKTLTLVLRGNGQLTREITIPNAKTYDPTGEQTDKDKYFNDADLKEFANRLKNGIGARITLDGEKVNQIYAIKEKSDSTTIILAG